MNREELEKAIASLEEVILYRFDPSKLEEYSRRVQMLRTELLRLNAVSSPIPSRAGKRAAAATD